MIEKQVFWVEWWTWHTKEISTPWDFWYLKNGNRWKNINTNLANNVTIEQIADAISSKKSNWLEEFQEKNTNDVLLGAFVPAVDEHDVRKQVLDLFDDSEFKRIEQVNEEKITQIAKLLGILPK